MNSAANNPLSYDQIRDDVDEFTLDHDMRRSNHERSELEDWYGFDDEGAWEATGLSLWAIAYLRQRAIPAAVVHGRGAVVISTCEELPDLALGRWSSKQRAHLEKEGIEALVLPWHRAEWFGEASYELKWSEPRLELNPKGEVTNTIKTEFPAGVVDGPEDGDMHFDAWAVDEYLGEMVDRHGERNDPATCRWEEYQSAVLLTEGVCKADAMRVQADLEGIPVRVFAMRGVYQALVGKSRRQTFSSQPSEAVNVVLESEGPVFLVFDPDARDNWAVRQAVVETARVIAENSRDRQRRVFIIDVPTPVKEIGGVDDYLAWMRERASDAPSRNSTDGGAGHAFLLYEEAKEPMYHLLRSALEWSEWARQTALFEDDDSGRADRIADELIHRHAKHANGIGLLLWDGKRLAADRSKSEAAAISRCCADRVISAHGKKETRAQRTYARSKAALDRALALALSDSRLQVEPSALGANPLELNTQDGIVSLKDGTLRPHDPQALNTKITECGYDPLVPTPTWDRFIDQVFLSDTESIDFFYAWAGSVLVGRSETAEGLLIAFGTGQNGKSTLFNLMGRMLKEYAVTLSTNVLAGDDREHERIKLLGARFVIMPEPPTSWPLDAGALKQTFSRDTITARALYKDPVEFEPTYTGVVCANTLPTIKDTDDGTWRRINFLPFDLKVAEKDKDRNLAEKLWEERDGILARLVQGAIQYLESGLPRSSANEAFKASYRDEADWLGRWVEEECVIAADAQMDRARGYKEYMSWCYANNCSTNLSASAWLRQMQERGFVQRGLKKSNGKRYLIGARVVEAFEKSALRSRSEAT